VVSIPSSPLHKHKLFLSFRLFVELPEFARHDSNNNYEYKYDCNYNYNYSTNKNKTNNYNSGWRRRMRPNPRQRHKGLSGRNVTSFGSNYPQSWMSIDWASEWVSVSVCVCEGFWLRFGFCDFGWDWVLGGSCKALARASLQLPYSEHWLRVAEAVIYLRVRQIQAYRLRIQTIFLCF